MIGSASILSISFKMKAGNNLESYKRAKEGLLNHGWDERFMEQFTKTLCSRNAARVAAMDTGFKKEIDEYYRQIKRQHWFLPPWFN